MNVYNYQIGATHLHTAEALNVLLLSPAPWAWIAGCPFMSIGGTPEVREEVRTLRIDAGNHPKEVGCGTRRRPGCIGTQEVPDFGD